MDSELKEVLEAIRDENATAHAETQRRFEALDAKFETAQAENAAAHIKTREHAELIAERYQHRLDLVVERVVSNGEKIDQFRAEVDQVTSNHESRITRLEISASLQGRI
jgi:uncharacterized coiled-coil protein SlyX